MGRSLVPQTPPSFLWQVPARTAFSTFPKYAAKFIPNPPSPTPMPLAFACHPGPSEGSWLKLTTATSDEINHLHPHRTPIQENRVAGVQLTCVPRCNLFFRSLLSYRLRKMGPGKFLSQAAQYCGVQVYLSLFGHVYSAFDYRFLVLFRGLSRQEIPVRVRLDS